VHKTLVSRVIGFVSSLILTLLSFLIFTHLDFFHLGIGLDVVTVFVLAVLQFIFQSICFLNVCSETGPRWNLVVFVSTLSIVLIIIIFSIWVMNHLNYNMMGSM